MAHRRALGEYYRVLGLAPGASLREVKQAYRAGVKRWHPDQFSRDARLEQGAEEKLKELNEAYTALCGREGRARGRGYSAYGRPAAGQQAWSYTTSGAGAASGWQYDAWYGSAARGSFKFQSAYYRARQAKARAGASGDGGDPYSAGYAGYAVRPRFTKATIRLWIIIVFVFSVLAYVNPLSSSLLRGASRRGAVSQGARPRQASPAPLPPLAGDNSAVPIVTIVERPKGHYNFPVASFKKTQTQDSSRAESDKSHAPLIH